MPITATAHVPRLAHDPTSRSCRRRPVQPCPGPGRCADAAFQDVRRNKPRQHAAGGLMIALAVYAPDTRPQAQPAEPISSKTICWSVPRSWRQLLHEPAWRTRPSPGPRRPLDQAHHVPGHEGAGHSFPSRRRPIRGSARRGGGAGVDAAPERGGHTAMPLAAWGRYSTSHVGIEFDLACAGRSRGVEARQHQERCVTTPASAECSSIREQERLSPISAKYSAAHERRRNRQMAMSGVLPDERRRRQACAAPSQALHVARHASPTSATE